MKFFTGCSQLRGLPSSLQKPTYRPMSFTAPPDSWPRISQSLIATLHGEIGLAPDTDGAKAGESGFGQSKAATGDEFQLLRSHG
jgi:hypothetical protein